MVITRTSQTSAAGPPLCINPACFRWGTSVSDFLTAASNAGFTRAEVSIQQILSLADVIGGIDAVAATITDLGVRVEAFSGLLPNGPVLPAPLLIDNPAWSAAVDTLDQRLTAAAALGCRRATIVCNPRTDLPPADATLIAVDRLGLLADRAAGYGIRLAVEFIGLHAGLSGILDGPHGFIGDLAGLVALLDQLRHPNVGVLLDTCHLYAASVPEADIRALPPGSVEFVQVSDVPHGITAAGMRDDLRCQPGEGMLDLPSLLAAVADTGYSGPASIELFSPSIWKLTPEQAAHRLYASAAGSLSPASASGGRRERGGRS